MFVKTETNEQFLTSMPPFVLDIRICACAGLIKFQFLLLSSLQYHKIAHSTPPSKNLPTFVVYQVDLGH